MPLHQVEISSRCNLKCRYCPQPRMKRPKVDMTFDTWKKAIAVFKKDPSPDNCLAMHVFGEPLLHDDLIKFVRYGKKQGVDLWLSTNGVLLTRQIVDELQEAGLKCLTISEHQGTKDILDKVLSDVLPHELPITIWGRESNHTFAGQVELPQKGTVTGKTKYCPYRDDNGYVVLADGSINTCCIAVEKQGIEHTLDDILDGKSYTSVPIKLCGSCKLGKFGWGKK